MLADQGKAPTRVQLLRTGKFRDAEGGDFEVSEETLQSFIANFEKKVRGYDDGKLPIDYFHESQKIAAGWISNLTVEGKGKDAKLFADVTWTPAGAQKVQDGELRYLSVEFHFDYEPNEGEKKSYGPTLFGAGLTNRPFVKGMKPVKALSEKGNPMSLEQALAKIAELEAALAKLQPPAPVQAGAMPPAAQAALAERDKAVKELAEAREQIAKAAKDAEFTKMLSDGKAVEAQRSAFLAGDVAKFAELAQPLNMSGKGNAGDGSGAADKSEKDPQKQILELAEAEVLRTKGSVSLNEAIQKVLRENAELNKGYRKACGVRLTA